MMLLQANVVGVDAAPVTMGPSSSCIIAHQSPSSSEVVGGNKIGGISEPGPTTSTSAKEEEEEKLPSKLESSRPPARAQDVAAVKTRETETQKEEVSNQARSSRYPWFFGWPDPPKTHQRPTDKSSPTRSPAEKASSSNGRQREQYVLPSSATVCSFTPHSVRVVVYDLPLQKGQVFKCPLPWYSTGSIPFPKRTKKLVVGKSRLLQVPGIGPRCFDAPSTAPVIGDEEERRRQDEAVRGRMKEHWEEQTVRHREMVRESEMKRRRVKREQRGKDAKDPGSGREVREVAEVRGQEGRAVNDDAVPE